ncbi:sulfatase-like hydrolase/transferase [Flavicella marina]|uniref:sulfatase-like hydrolase/transferase n=1 Tax=Flavicella marina TaxID=1475951 RepID=UPI00126415EE|nr:sulfatase-like hydrolase/transferase [Flavicella marina]
MKKIYYYLFFFLFLTTVSCSSSIIEEDEVPADEELIEESIEEDEAPQDLEHPNILLIIADDVSLDATPNYLEDLNAIKPEMPNLEKLMNNGLVFDNAWAYARCSPTRASIITGKHGVQNGIKAPGGNVSLSSSHKSLQSYINENTSNAYSTAVFGKWHLGHDVDHPTNDTKVGTFSGNLSSGVPDYWSYDLIENETLTTLSSTTDAERMENYSTTKYTQLAMDWRDEQTKPWFIWLAYNAAHTPFHMPDDYLISNASQGRPSTNLYMYLAMLEAMDYEMGRFIDSMSEAEKENTIIIYVGDNGTPVRVSQYTDNDKHCKGSIYQGGINVPFVVSGLGTRVGRESEALVHTVDLYATIAELAGVDVSEIYQSKSVKSLLNDAGAASKEYIYTEVPGEGNDNGHYAVRNATYKLIYEIDTDVKELYDLSADPYEVTNLLIGNLSTTQQENYNNLLLEGKRVRGE